MVRFDTPPKKRSASNLRDFHIDAERIITDVSGIGRHAGQSGSAINHCELKNMCWTPASGDRLTGLCRCHAERYVSRQTRADPPAGSIVSKNVRTHGGLAGVRKSNLRFRARIDGAGALRRTLRCCAFLAATRADTSRSTLSLLSCNDRARGHPVARMITLGSDRPANLFASRSDGARAARPRCRARVRRSARPMIPP